MYNRNYSLVLAFILVSFFAKAQTHIVKDSIIFSFSKHQIDSLITAQIGPVGSALGLKFDIDVHKVIYKTLNYDSTPTIASGIVMIPKSSYCAIPIISYQHGTTLQKSQVPSRWSGSEKLIVLVLASSGMIGCMPDYLGLGDGLGYHPYQNARTEAFSVIDIIRAGKEVCDSVHISYGKQLFLVGYSQGGHATMAAHKMIQEKLGTEMTVTASAPMSGAYDMSGVQTDMLLLDQPYASPYYLPYLIFGNNPIYHFFNTPSDILKAPYATTLPPLMNGITGPSAVNNAMNDTVKKIFTTAMLDSFTANPNHFFRTFLKDNDVYNWKPMSPVRMYFCTLDENVSFQNTYKAFNTFKALGAPFVDTINSGAYKHTPCAQPSLLNAKFWLDNIRNLPLESTASATNSTTPTSLDGTLTANVVGGIPPYKVTWSNGSIGANISGVKAGTYSYTVLDSSHCTTSGTVTVQYSTTGLSDITLSSIQIYPNPTNGELHFSKNEFLGNELKITIYNQLGQIQKEATLLGLDLKLAVDDLPTGVYAIRLNNQFTTTFLKK